jgi:hypothetical protein
MNTEVEELRAGELLRTGMERFAGDMRLPAGIVRRAVRRRRRRLILRSGAGLTAALAAGAAAVATVGMPGARHHGDDVAFTARYVEGRVEHALRSAVAGDVAQLSVSVSTMFAGKTASLTAAEWFHARRWRAVTRLPSGQLLSDESAVSTAAGMGLTFVSYPIRTWGREVPFRPPARGVQPTDPGSCGDPAKSDPFADVAPANLALAGSLSGLTSAAMSQDLRTAISCGTLAIAGRQHVDGIDAIRLTSVPKSLLGETIWVDPRSYLPVRLTIKGAYATPVQRGAAARQGQLTADFSWLPPTRQNLAKLSAPIPAGYQRAPLNTVLQAAVDQLLRVAESA